MDEKTKYYSQIFDAGVRAGIIAQIDERVLLLLIGLMPFMDSAGRCFPSGKYLSKILGISVHTVSKRVKLAKRTLYRGEPVLEVYQEKNLVKGKWEFSNNQYKVSKHIREDLISRFISVGGKSHAKKDEAIPQKSNSPKVGFPLSVNTPTNDTLSFTLKPNNESEQMFKSDRPFKGTTLTAFEETAVDEHDYRCLEIAKWLEEKYIEFILSAKNDAKCGMNGIETAFSMTKDMSLRHKARNKGRLFNFYIKEYKQGKR